MDAAYHLASKDDRMLAVVAVTIAIAFFVSLFAIWQVMAADVAPVCLTKEQARAKWPKEWLYWHTAHHCWDNVRGTANTASKADGTVQIIRAPKPNRAMKADRKDMAARPGFDTNDNMVRPLPKSGSGRTIKVESPSIYFPDLMPGGGTVVAMLQTDAMTTWPLVADFDADPPRFEPWRERITGTGGKPD
jgi:hypothetical protein